MRLHRNLVYTTIDSLNAIFNEGEYADKVVARALKKYGMILADGGNIVLTAQSDVNTAAKYADLKFYPQSLNSLKPQNFEVVPPEIPEPFPANSPFVPTVFGAMIKAKWLDCVKNP